MRACSSKPCNASRRVTQTIGRCWLVQWPLGARFGPKMPTSLAPVWQLGPATGLPCISRLDALRLVTPHPVNGALDLGFHAADEFAVGGDQGLLGFDLGDDGALGFEVREGDFDFANQLRIQIALISTA